MKTSSILTTISCAVTLWAVATACSSDSLPELEKLPAETSFEMPEAFQKKVRTQPYPKMDNTLIINPAPFIVPQSMKTDERLQFALSTSATFDTPETVLSQPKPWCMYNLHHPLTPGSYYWRFRSTDANGENCGEWSQTYSFEVKQETPRFVTPDFDTFLQNAPRTYPRLYCFLQARLEEARNQAYSHPEYGQLIARANATLATDYESLGNLYAQSSMLSQHATFLYQASMFLQQEKYTGQLYRLLQKLLSTPPTDAELLTDNFTATHILHSHIAAYDILYNCLSADEKQATEQLMLRVVRHFYAHDCGMQENHLFDNHFWQQNMRIVFQALFLIYDHSAYSEEVLPMLQYYYELWTARAPAGGFNRDGLWHNGTGYFSANVHTLAYMPLLLSYITRADFLQHPWYQQAGQALVFSFPPASKSNGFGDGSEKGDQPNRLTAAFADFLARETYNNYAGWYASECNDLLLQDYELRLYRMCSDKSYGSQLPENTPKLVWYQDIGEVAVHTDLVNRDHDLALSFRSSTFGSGSHTTASQNAFNLLFRGADVYRSSGYYQNFADAHNLMSYRHSRAHNTILVNGIGQPYSTEGYGYVARALDGANISYCLGDASQAYRGISHDPMWINYFAQAGIEQTPANGFGETPLSRFRRHIIVLHPDIVLTYDELEASEAVRWDWLLHSPVQFSVRQEEQTIDLHQTDKDFIASTRLFATHPLTLDVTDQFVVPPSLSNDTYPNQWHLNAHIANQAKLRILSITQVRDEQAGIYAIRHKEDCFQIGHWTIKAELDADQPPRLLVSHATLPCFLGYGEPSYQAPQGVYIPRANENTVLLDESTGRLQMQEAAYQLPPLSRAVKP